MNRIKRSTICISTVIIIFLLSIFYKNNMNNRKTENPSIGKVSLYIETYLAGANQPTNPPTQM